MAALNTLAWILTGGLLMSLVALVGGLTVLLPPKQLERLLLPLISLAAGSMLGGALFHMLPEGLAAIGHRDGGLYVAAGFTGFLALEQCLEWHHSHRPLGPNRHPMAVLILIGDALHNFIGGLGIASTFLINPAAGIAAWFAAVAHEIPQELGDFAILVHSGWRTRSALRWNFISALTFPLGAVLAWLISQRLPVAGLVLFASGNFLYIAASDLVPEIKAATNLRTAGQSFGWFSAGLVLMYAMAHP